MLRPAFSERIEVVLASKKSRPIDWETLFAGISRGKSPVEYSANCEIFCQGQPADSLWYLRRGEVKLTVISKQGEVGILAMLSAGEFFGEGCLAGQQLRMVTATAVTACTLDKLEKLLMMRILHERHEISELFVAHLLSHFGKESRAVRFRLKDVPETMVPFGPGSRHTMWRI